MNILEARRRMLGAGVYKKTVTGNPAIAQGSLARMYPGIEMQGWTEQDGTPTPENPVPIVSAGNWNEETQKWEYEIEVGGNDGSSQAVLLTSDRPLTKWDKLEKRNGQWGWEYKSDEIVFDGSEDEGWTYSGQMLGFAQAYVNLPNAYIFTSSELSVLLCNKFSVFGGNEWVKPTKECISIGFSMQAGRIGINIEDITINDNETLRIWLSENPMTVCYETSTKTFTHLSASEQEQMNALHTNRPTTVLSNDADCEMTLTYKTKKSLEVTA